MSRPGPVRSERNGALNTYGGKRSFTVTLEPPPRVQAQRDGPLLFVAALQPLVSIALRRVADSPR